jgi:sec-independent protein translocase protein TatA
MPLGIGLPEVIIVLVIALLIFGPKRLPDLGRSLGSGLREFKDSITGGSKDDEPPVIAANAADERKTPEPHDDAVSSSRG